MRIPVQKMTGPDHDCREINSGATLKTLWCPCYIDNCNVYQTTWGTPAGSLGFNLTLMAGHTDKYGLGTGGTFPLLVDGSNNNGGDTSTSSNTPPPGGQPAADNNKAGMASGDASPLSLSPTPTAGTLSAHQALTCSITSRSAALLTLHVYIYIGHLYPLLWL